MNTEQKQVRDFMLAAQQELPPIPTIPSLEVRILRATLILEEALETIHGLGVLILDQYGEMLDLGKILYDHGAPPNLVEIADGCADLKVVTDGCALACGIDLEPVMAEVSRSNMSKFIDGHRREDGKWIKGPSYSPADIGPILEAQKTPQEPVWAAQTPPEPSKGLQQAPGAEFGPILDPRQAGEELVCEYRGFQITRFRPNGFPVLHYFNGDLEHGLATNLGGDETILRLVKDGIDEFRYAEEQQAKPGSGMAVGREAKHEPFNGAETFALMDENFYSPCGEVLGKLQAFCTKMENERDGLRVEYESRVIWIDRIIEILGCKNNDGFHCVDVHEYAKTKLARSDALAVAAKATCAGLGVLFWTTDDGDTVRDGRPDDDEVNKVMAKPWLALQSAITAYETGGEA